MSKFRMYDEDKIERTLERKHNDRARGSERRFSRQQKAARGLDLNHQSTMSMNEWVLNTIEQEKM